MPNKWEPVRAIKSTNRVRINRGSIYHSRVSSLEMWSNLSIDKMLIYSRAIFEKKTDIKIDDAKLAVEIYSSSYKHFNFALKTPAGKQRQRYRITVAFNWNP